MKALILFAAALLLPGLASAKEIDAMIGKLDLPFEYELVGESHSTGINYGFTSTNTKDIRVLSGPAKGETIKLVSHYFAPQNVEAGVVQGWIREEIQEQVGKGTGRSPALIKLGDHEFNYLDRQIERDGGKAWEHSIAGVVGGATLRVMLGRPEKADIDADLVAALKKLRFDYEGTLKLRGKFDAEAREIVKGNQLFSPLGVMPQPPASQTRLGRVYVRRDGSGKPLRLIHTYYFSKTGFWTVQSMGVTMGCGVGDTERAETRKDVLTFENDDDDTTYSAVTAPVASSLGGVPAQHTTASQSNRSNPYLRLKVARWFAEQGDNYYSLSLTRMNGSPLEKHITTQLSKNGLTCRMDSGLAAPKSDTPPVRAGSLPIGL